MQFSCKNSGTTSSREQVDQRGVFDANQPADEKGGGRADPVGDHHRDIGERQLQRDRTRFSIAASDAAKASKRSAEEANTTGNGQSRVRRMTRSAAASATGMTTRRSGCFSLIMVSAGPKMGSIRRASPGLLPGTTERSVAAGGIECLALKAGPFPAARASTGSRDGRQRWC